MRRVNNEKARAKIYIQNDIRSVITNIMSQSNEVQGLVAQLSQAMSGSASGSSNDLITTAQQTLSSLSQSLQYLHKAQQTANQLDITEEVPDD